LIGIEFYKFYKYLVTCIQVELANGSVGFVQYRLTENKKFYDGTYIISCICFLEWIF